MDEAERPESTSSWGAIDDAISTSVIGLPSPFLATAAASTRRNSWSRTMRARSLSCSCGQSARFVEVTPGPCTADAGPGRPAQLIHTYLLGRHDQTTGRLSRAIESAEDGRGKILAVFDAQAKQLRQPGFNGCAFVAASTEAPRGGLIDEDARAFRAFRTWIRTMFTDLSEQAGASDPHELGQQLHVLYDGASLAVRMDHDPTIAQAVRAAVAALLDAHHPQQETRRP